MIDLNVLCLAGRVGTSGKQVQRRRKEGQEQEHDIKAAPERVRTRLLLAFDRAPAAGSAGVFVQFRAKSTSHQPGPKDQLFQRHTDCLCGTGRAQT